MFFLQNQLEVSLDNSDSIEKMQDAVNPRGSKEKAGEKIDGSVEKTKDAMKQ